jgi:hypothetical protein
MEFTAPYSPEQNGVAERLNRTILERLIAVLAAKNVSKILWPYITESIVYIKNRTYSKLINKTPYEALLGTIPNIANLRILGSLVYRLIPLKNSKLANKAEKGILVGFQASNNYKVYLPATKRVITLRDVKIIEEDIEILENSNNSEFQEFIDNYNDEIIDLSNKSLENDDT